MTATSTKLLIVSDNYQIGKQLFDYTASIFKSVHTLKLKTYNHALAFAPDRCILIVWVNTLTATEVESLKELKATHKNITIILMVFALELQDKQLLNTKIFSSIIPLFNKLDSLQTIIEKTIAETNSRKTNTELTNREIEVLRLVALQYTTKQISEQLHLSTHTINTHRRRLLAKLDVKNWAGLICKAYELKIL